MPAVTTFSPSAPGSTVKPLFRQFGEQLGVQQVNLAQVRLGRILRDSGPVLDGDAAVRIALDAQAFEQNGRLRSLAEAVLRMRADDDDSGGHGMAPEAAKRAQARRTPIASISLR